MLSIEANLKIFKSDSCELLMYYIYKTEVGLDLNKYIKYLGFDSFMIIYLQVIFKKNNLEMQNMLIIKCAGSKPQSAAEFEEIWSTMAVFSYSFMLTIWTCLFMASGLIYFKEYSKYVSTPK